LKKKLKKLALRKDVIADFVIQKLGNGCFFLHNVASWNTF